MKGFIRPRGKGFTAYWSTTDGNGQRHQHTKGGFRTQGDAQKYLNGILPQVDQGKGRPDRRMTVEQLLTDWLAAKASEGLKPCTVGMYRNVVNGWVIRYVGGLRVDQLTPSRAAQLVETLRSPAGSSLGRGGLQPRSTGPPVPEGLHPVGSRNGSGSATRWLVSSARRQHGRGRRHPTHGPSQKRRHSWHRCPRMTSGQHGGSSSLATSPGRAGWAQVGQRRSRRGGASGGRDSGGDRGQSDPLHAQDCCRNSHDTARRGARGRADLALGQASADRLPAGEAWEDTDYLFVDGLGRPWRPERISRTFLRLTAAAGLRRIRLHDTRHTVASLMLADGVPAKVVQEMLGHEDVTITLAL